MTAETKAHLALHIGMGKAGSSFIQRLVEQSSLDPDWPASIRIIANDPILMIKPLGAQGDSATAVEAGRRLLRCENDEAAREVIVELVSRLKEVAGRSSAIWSAENLSDVAVLHPKRLRGLLSRLSEVFEVSVLLVIREPSEDFASAWAQWGFRHAPVASRYFDSPYMRRRLHAERWVPDLVEGRSGWRLALLDLSTPAGGSLQEATADFLEPLGVKEIILRQRIARQNEALPFPMLPLLRADPTSFWTSVDDNRQLSALKKALELTITGTGAERSSLAASVQKALLHESDWSAGDEPEATHWYAALEEMDAAARTSIPAGAAVGLLKSLKSLSEDVQILIEVGYVESEPRRRDPYRIEFGDMKRALRYASQRFLEGAGIEIKDREALSWCQADDPGSPYSFSSRLVSLKELLADKTDFEDASASHDFVVLNHCLDCSVDLGRAIRLGMMNVRSGGILILLLTDRRFTPDRYQFDLVSNSDRDYLQGSVPVQDPMVRIALDDDRRNRDTDQAGDYHRWTWMSAIAEVVALGMLSEVNMMVMEASPPDARRDSSGEFQLVLRKTSGVRLDDLIVSALDALTVQDIDPNILGNCVLEVASAVQGRARLDEAGLGSSPNQSLLFLWLLWRSRSDITGQLTNPIIDILPLRSWCVEMSRFEPQAGLAVRLMSA